MARTAAGGAVSYDLGLPRVYGLVDGMEAGDEARSRSGRGNPNNDPLNSYL